MVCSQGFVEEASRSPQEQAMDGVGRFARIHDPEGNPIELWEPETESVTLPIEACIRPERTVLRHS